MSPMITTAGSPLRSRGSALRRRAGTSANPVPIDAPFQYATNIWRANRYQGNGPWVDIKSGLVAQKGAAGQAAIISTGLLVPDQVAGNVATADSVTIAGDVDLRIYMSADDWTPSATTYLVGDYGGGGDRSFYVRLLASSIRFGYSEDGTTILSELSTAGISATDGDTIWVRITLDLDNGASGHDITFYTSTDGSVWTQLGDVVTVAGTLSGLFATTGSMCVGGLNSASANTVGGVVRSFELYDAGTLVMSPDFSAQTPGTLSFDDAQSNTWTINQSADGSDDPTFLDYDGTKYVWLPGSAGNYISTPDAAALDITGDLDVQVYVLAPDWTPASDLYVGPSKWVGPADQSWLFVLKADGTLTFGWSDDGADTGATYEGSGVATGFADGTAHWLRVTVDVDNGAGDTDVTFYTSEDGATWSQLGAVQSPGFTTSIFSATAPVELGAIGAGTYGYGAVQVLAARVYDGIAGTLVADFDADRDFSSHSTLTSSTTGEVWTFNRTTAAAGARLSVVTADMFLYDGGDYFYTTSPPSFFTTNAWSVAVGFRSFSQPGSAVGLFRVNSTGAGYVDCRLTATTDVFNGRRDGDSTGPDTAGESGVAIHDGNFHVGVVRWDGSSLRVAVDSTADETTDSTIAGDAIAGVADLLIGSDFVGSSFANVELPVVVAAGSVWTDTQVDAICAQLIARNP